MSQRKKKEKLVEKKRRKEQNRRAREFKDLADRCKGTSSMEMVDRSKVRSASVMPEIPDYYQNKSFECIDCSKEEVWTAQQQKRWHEEQGGAIESTAIRCRDCRAKERQRKAAARKVHLEGLARKKLGES